MFKPQLVVSNDEGMYPITQAAYRPTRTAHSVFNALQMRYGRVFVFRFWTGVRNENGNDHGVAKARNNWANYLSQFPDAVLVKALAQVLHSNRTLPPTLLEMAGRCDAIMRGEGVQQDADADMDVDTELLSVAGLDILKRAIADAVANAGGDEARELVRLDRMLVVPSTKTAE